MQKDWKKKGHFLVQKDWKKSWVILPHISRRKKKCHFLSRESRRRQNFLFTFVVLIPERVTRSQLRAFGPPLLRSSASLRSEIVFSALLFFYRQWAHSGPRIWSRTIFGLNIGPKGPVLGPRLTSFICFKINLIQSELFYSSIKFY